MAPLDKAAQEAEAKARAESKANLPGETRADALETIDDSGDTGLAPAPQAREPAEPATPPAPQLRPDKRSDIVARFRADRNTEVDAQADEISDFTRSGMPPEFVPAPEAPIAPVEASQPEPAPVEPTAPQKVKVKVRGQEMEITQDELLAHAQKSLAGEDYLEEGRSKVNELDKLISQARNKLSQPTGQDGNTPPPQNSGPQATDPAASPSGDGNPQHPADDITRVIEAIQFGDPADAHQLLSNTIRKAASESATAVVQAERLRDEGARTMKTLEDFKAQHPELAKDPFAKAVIEQRVIELQTEDLKAIGVDPNNLRQGQPVSADDISVAHRYYRSQGLKLRQPGEMLETAKNDFLAWKGTGKEDPNPKPVPPAPPRVEVTVDRAARRQAVPQSPNRSATPPAPPQPAAQPRDRSSIVEQMARGRNLPRGRVVA
jgi:hypothetical protein